VYRRNDDASTGAQLNSTFGRNGRQTMTRKALLLVSIMAAAGLSAVRVQGVDPAKVSAFVLEPNTLLRLGDAVILCGDVKGTSVSDVLILMDRIDRPGFTEVIKAKSGTFACAPAADKVTFSLSDATVCRPDPDHDRNGPGKGLLLYRVAVEFRLDLPIPAAQK
jgi:hypothetical protein